MHIDLIVLNSENVDLKGAFCIFNVKGPFNPVEIMRMALTTAKEGGFDVYNCLDHIDIGEAV